MDLIPRFVLAIPVPESYPEAARKRRAARHTLCCERA
jgi:hypothetical protein